MIETLTAAVQRLFVNDIDGMVDAAVRAEYIELSRAADRIESRRARLLAAIHRRGIPFENGASSTPAWVQANTGQRKGEARASLEAGLALETLPLTAKAWAQGEISSSAARAICEGRPDGHEDAYSEVEEILVSYAADRDWRDLRAVIAHCRRCADALDDREPADRNGVYLSKTTDRWALTGDVDDLGGETVNAALSTAMGKPSPDDLRSPSKRRADALVEICRHFLDHADLPMEGGEAPHITVGVPWEAVREGVTASSVPNLFGPSLSPAQLAEILCDCKLGRVVFGPDSQPLDVGREHRTAPTTYAARSSPATSAAGSPAAIENRAGARSITSTPGTRRRNEDLQLHPALPVPPRPHPPTRLRRQLRRHHLHGHQTHRRTVRQYIAIARPRDRSNPSTRSRDRPSDRRSATPTRDAGGRTIRLVGMRRVVLVVLVAAGCTGESHRSAPLPPPSPRERAEKLCRAKVPDPGRLVSSDPTTVGVIRSTPIGTIGPTQYHQFPTLGREHFAAWCWTRDGDTFTIYKAATGEKADAIASETGIDPSSAHGAPQLP